MPDEGAAGRHFQLTEATWFGISFQQQAYLCQMLHVAGRMERLNQGSEVKEGIGHANCCSKRSGATDLWLNVLKSLAIIISITPMELERESDNLMALIRPGETGDTIL